MFPASVVQVDGKLHRCDPPQTCPQAGENVPGGGADRFSALPAAEEVDQRVLGLLVEVCRLDAGGDRHARPHLGPVLSAVRAVGEMDLESGGVAGGQGALQVVRHQLDGLLADEGATTTEPPHRSLTACSSARRTRERPRWRRTRWLTAVRSSTAHTSSLDSPSTSRNVTTCFWPSGRAAMAPRTASAAPAAVRRSSTSSAHGVGGVAHAPDAAKRRGSTAGSSAPIGIDRRSRRPVVRARLAQIWKIHALSVERSSNRPIPRTTASHVSCPTSPATARLTTNVPANRTSRVW